MLRRDLARLELALLSVSGALSIGLLAVLISAVSAHVLHAATR